MASGHHGDFVKEEIGGSQMYHHHYNTPPASYDTPPYNTPPYNTSPYPQTTTTQNVVIVKEQRHGGEWTAGLFGCFGDLTGCLMSFFCHPFYKCCLSKKMGENFCMPLCLGPADLMVLRMKLRTMNKIPGGAIADCCTVTWCACCAAVQMSREWDSTVMTRI
ncbi:cornifelin homolog B-like [Ptychodera flava]|uniref:cornifelin homolog B-like n=1 Tax=Ptychodera flava TaxID=63121 RepID=UPI003969D0E5